MVVPPWLKPLNAPERIPGWLCAPANPPGDTPQWNPPAGLPPPNPCCDPENPLEGAPSWKPAA